MLIVKIKDLLPFHFASAKRLPQSTGTGRRQLPPAGGMGIAPGPPEQGGGIRYPLGKGRGLGGWNLMDDLLLTAGEPRFQTLGAGRRERDFSWESGVDG